MAHVTQEQSGRQLLAGFGKRFLELGIKLVSTKGLVLALATLALFRGKMDGWMWLVAAGVVIGGKTAAAALEKLKK